MNTYSYANNNPVTLTDPEGLEPWDPSLKGSQAPSGASWVSSGSGSSTTSTQKVCGRFGCSSTHPGVAIAGRERFESSRDFAKAAGRLLVFDERSCEDGISGWCAVEVASAVPVLKPLKALKVLKSTKAAPEVQGGATLFKLNSPQALRDSGWRDGDYFLRNEWKGNARDTWKANASLLRKEMRSRGTIFDSYVDDAGELIPTGGFLNMERNV